MVCSEYIFLFLSLNFEVFLLITYFENRLEIAKEDMRTLVSIKKYPTVTVIVPCWNEELTVSKTVHSLLSLDYPKNKLDVKLLIEEDDDKKNCVVVSDDKDIFLYARSLGARVMKVGAFTSKPQVIGANSNSDKKYISLSHQEKINKELSAIWLKEKQ